MTVPISSLRKKPCLSLPEWLEAREFAHSVRRVIVGLPSIFVSISLRCKSKSHKQPYSAVDYLGFTSDSCPGGKGGRRREQVLWDPSSSKDKRLLTPQWPCTPGIPKRHLSVRAWHSANLSWRRYPFWSVRFLHVIYLVQ